jgi:hypothetical protein
LSHQPERKEKNCLSCGTQVQGRFCQVCGQENIVTKQSFWSLAKHFIYDVFHFDGKFFDTLKHLLFHPGRVPKDYVAGKRSHYLDPIRMYLFTSALFFLIFFSFEAVKVSGSAFEESQLSKMERLQVATDLHMQYKGVHKDSAYEKAMNALLDSTLLVRMEKGDTATGDSTLLYKGERYRLYAAFDTTETAYDSTLARQGWFKRQVLYKIIGKDRKYEDPNEAARQFIDNVMHRIPILLFISLPLFALILKLLYSRRKDFYYSDHAVFTLYHYIFSFLLILLIMGVSGLANWLQWQPLKWLGILLMLSGFFYLYKGMRVFYEQSRLKTIGKFIALNLLGLLTIIALLFLFILITALF